MPTLKNTPEVRFPGFEADWEALPFNEVFLPLKNRSYSRADLTFTAGEVENIHYGDILVKYGSVVDCNVEELPFVVDARRSDFAGSLLTDGDVLLADAAEDESVGKAVELAGTSGRAVTAGLHTIACRPSRSFSRGYLGYYLNSPAYHRQLLPLMQGTKVLSVSRSSLARTTVHAPSIPEQAKIGNLFQNLDSLIGLQNSKLEKSQQIKNAMLSKMFPQPGAKVPEVRFPGFEGEWKEHELTAVATFSKGAGYSKSDLVERGAPIILYGRLYTKYESVISGVDTFAVLRPGSKLSTGDEVIMPASGESSKDIARASAVVQSGVILAGDLNIIKPAKFIQPHFLALHLSSGEVHLRLAERAQGKSVVHLHGKDFAGITVQLPSLHEQTKIGEFFEQLDALIDLQVKKNKKLDQIKRSLLSKIFV